MVVTFVRCAVVAAATLLLLLPSPALAGDVPTCTQEQKDAYGPYLMGPFNVTGCDESTFKICSDDCLVARQLAVQYAPNCSTGSRGIRTTRETAVVLLAKCEDVRANTTNKYFPQVVAGAPPCEYLETKIFGMDRNFSDCSYNVEEKCSDECLKIIETKISTAPVCSYASGGYTLGEGKKYVLADCLNARKQDLKANVVLNTVAAVSVKDKSSSVQTTTATSAVAVAAAGLLVAALSLV